MKNTAIGVLLGICLALGAYSFKEVGTAQAKNSLVFDCITVRQGAPQLGRCENEESVCIVTLNGDGVSCWKK